MGRKPFVAMVLAVLVAAALSLLLGRYPGPLLSSPSAILGDDLAVSLVLNLRLPRILAAVLLGMVLAAAGLVFQMLFRNPLVDSGFLGVSAGASFGASLAIVVGPAAPDGPGRRRPSSPCLGLAASLRLAQRIRYGGWVLRLVLAGIAVSARSSPPAPACSSTWPTPCGSCPTSPSGCSAGCGPSPGRTPQILPVALPCLAVIYLMRWRLNLLALREETAFSLGAAPRPRAARAPPRRGGRHRRGGLQGRADRLGGADRPAHRPAAGSARRATRPARRDAPRRAVRPPLRRRGPHPPERARSRWASSPPVRDPGLPRPADHPPAGGARA